MGMTTLMSLDEFERLEGPHQLELLQGELIRVPPPQRRHMEICERLYALLKAAIDDARKTNAGASFGKVHIGMGYLIPGASQSWLRLDVSFTHVGQTGEKYSEGAPLIAFEVVSENDTAVRLEGKIVEYLANGAV